ncbi:unnamed protein product [Bursaphelenchus xylophilus]|uniref:(pine wood nematode) hypothetical protein n=1 Tax=Bursaphelenchus xylophilus TaxID=6326 RepID=A0A1I7RQJ2_BURXY|nr:unnamed protein product [Bursaphelenchus xylophilus]CAG9104679.1 unnamed protein product [Bursaphelenchus xylophilus]
MAANNVLKTVVLATVMGGILGLELYYFNDRGRAEPIRFMLHYAGINFTDYRFSRDDWNASKNSIMFNTLPALVQDMGIVDNSGAITRYVAHEASLLTPSYLEDAQMDDLFEKSQVLMQDFLTYIDIVEGRTPGNATASRPTLIDAPVKMYYPVIESYINPDTGLFGRYSIIYMDFVWYNLSDLLNSYAPDVLSNYTKSIQHWWKVDGYNNTNFQSYLQNRYVDFGRNGTIMITNVF